MQAYGIKLFAWFLSAFLSFIKFSISPSQRVVKRVFLFLFTRPCRCVITMCTAHRAGAVETPARRFCIRASFDSPDPFIYKIHLPSLPCSPFGPFLLVQPRLNFRFGLLLLVVFFDDLRIEPASCSKTWIRGFVHAGVRTPLIYVSSQIITFLTLCFFLVF